MKRLGPFPGSHPSFQDEEGYFLSLRQIEDERVLIDLERDPASFEVSSSSKSNTKRAEKKPVDVGLSNNSLTHDLHLKIDPHYIDWSVVFIISRKDEGHQGR